MIVCFALLISLTVSPAFGRNLKDWEAGDEVELTGHSFDEEYWSSSFHNETEKGENVTFDISYVNFGEAEAFLLSLHTIQKGDNVSTVPYQMYGMHFFTENNEEVFIGALLAFLMIYNDTNSNDLPDPGEDFMYVVPFGIGDMVNGSYTPEVEQIPAEKVEENHYRFGVRYKNLYALATKNPLATAIYKTGWLARFSELEVVYDIYVDEEAGTIRTETFYTIGQVSELWAVFLGLPIPADPKELPDSLGIGAVHYVTVFTSKYKVTSDDGNEIDVNIAQPPEGIDINVGENNDRALSIGLRGTYDLIDEDTDQKIIEGADAYNYLLEAKNNDKALVLWQLGFSAGAFSLFAYSLSDNIQEKYTDPLDLAKKSLNPFNPHGFYSSALWYGVCFPSWGGYRVEHDPVYTAYVNFDPQAGEDEEEDTPGFEMPLLAAASVVTMVGLAVKKRKREKV